MMDIILISAEKNHLTCVCFILCTFMLFYYVVIAAFLAYTYNPGSILMSCIPFQPFTRAWALNKTRAPGARRNFLCKINTLSFEHVLCPLYFFNAVEDNQKKSSALLNSQINSMSHSRLLFNLCVLHGKQ